MRRTQRGLLHWTPLKLHGYGREKNPKIKIVPRLYKFIVGLVSEGHHWMLVVCVCTC
uniref:Uncharacterized protein n=1 Tax=Seriola lalandi dorsalis TaxID=1841481 RepID=A0A3B4WEP2_SERLL